MSLSRRDFLKLTGSAALAGAWGTAWLRPSHAAFQEDSMSEALETTGSDVGNLYPFIKSQELRSEYRLSFLREEFTDLNAWKEQARSKVLEHLFYSPSPVDPQPEVLEREDRDDYVMERVDFNTTPDVRIPAFVLVPKQAEFPAPGIVALHDHGGFYFYGKEKLIENRDEHPVLTQFKRTCYEGKSIAAELARRGYVVVVIDMFYWGDRRLIKEGDPEVWTTNRRAATEEDIQAFNRRSWENEQLVGRTLYLAGVTWSGIMFWDDIRTVDYLISRPEVDPQRIGCVGLSVGGYRAAHLGALDERIRASVVCGWMTSYRPLIKNHVIHTVGWTKIIPGLYAFLDLPDIVTLTAPRALMCINGTQDQLWPLEGVHQAFAKITQGYTKAGVPERFRGILYDGPHEFNRAMQQEAWAWLDRWVKEAPRDR